MRYASTLILLLAAAAAGCGTETDDRPATFSYIHEAILVPSCATAVCHSTQNHIAGVDMEDRGTAYRRWESTLTSDQNAMYALVGGEVDPSTILLSAGRMPLDSPLPEADILLIGRWIDDGSEDN
jgi:hypothetical protein